MRIALAAAAVALAANSALAADAIVEVAPEPIAVVAPIGSNYVAVRGIYSAAFIDQDVTTPAVAGGLNRTVTVNVGGVPTAVQVTGDLPALGGELDNDYAVGGVLEAGRFLTPNLRVAAEFGYGYVATDALVVTDPAAAAVPITVNGNAGTTDLRGRTVLDGGANVLAGFAKGAYEVPVFENVGFVQRFSLYGHAGVGFVNVRPDIDFLNSQFRGSRVDGSDTVLAGKVGIGTVTKLTDRIELNSEYGYTFGDDTEFAITNTPSGRDIPISLDTKAHSFSTGLRFRF